MFTIGQANEDWWSFMHEKGNQNQISACPMPMLKSSSRLILIKYVNKFQITCQGINHAEMFWHILKQVATDKESWTSVPNSVKIDIYLFYKNYHKFYSYELKSRSNLVIITTSKMKIDSSQSAKLFKL